MNEIKTQIKTVRTWKQLLADPRVANVYKEYDDDMWWWWVELAPGWVSQGFRSIHETTKSACIDKINWLDIDPDHKQE
jgi:hypothetical protein